MNKTTNKSPINFETLLQKCEDAVLLIQDRFSDNSCLRVHQLYEESSNKRHDQFLQKLQITCNAKMKLENKCNNELKGLYIFGEMNSNKQIEPIYIGISRTIFRRLSQHSRGNNHNQASLAYLQAKINSGHVKGRMHLDLAMLKREQELIKNYFLVVIPETEDYDLYFMEVYIAGRLQTKWNSFKTH
ncbi:GIY-YIG nuclease family protein [Flavobacterium sp. PL11]|uniref:GIY-YIG nuclease family protein n=1 Tax=Flavobacterium sp. PL11 TaxID=3071717 RepID=UPI002E144900